ncbi:MULTISPECIES: hypothetical protein [unclassified Streptomyces]|uniref:hypothetical protein n=1 Tax=unclassified Streptomyces TaxID=2593676 RepID=UPI00081E05EA|nr:MULTISPECIES: hypothetical protein [unclassified Streptomyces]SCD89018.1 hypothetical protein GA0115243_104544 [Streptomyces sp. ScaeMP-e83]
MEYRRAAIPALVGGLLLTALLWWAGASTQALHLPGTADVLGGRAAAELEYWLTPWSYDPPASVRIGAETFGIGEDRAAVDNSRYLSLYTTGMQIRFVAVLLFFVPGALLLIRRLPPVNGRVPATLLAVWAWGVAAGTLALAVSAPWLIAANGRGSYRFLPQLAGMASGGRQILVLAALAAAVAAVLAARVTAKGAGPLPQAPAPAAAARLAATVGTAVIALSLVVLSYQPVAATLQTAFPGSGLLAEPGDLLRQWLLLGSWAGPAGRPAGDWFLYRVADALVLVVVWWALRRLPVLLTRTTVPAMALGAVCATVLGLLASQLAQMALTASDSGMRWGLVQLSAGVGGGVPAALTFGLLAGAAAAVTLRAAGSRSGAGEGGAGAGAVTQAPDGTEPGAVRPGGRGEATGTTAIGD